MATTTKRVSVKAASKQNNTAGVENSATASEQEICFRAYEIFQMRVGNGMTGDAMSDWLQAEKDLVSRTLAGTKKTQVRV